MGFSDEEMQANMAEWPGQDLKEGFLDARSVWGLAAANLLTTWQDLESPRRRDSGQTCEGFSGLGLLRWETHPEFEHHSMAWATRLHKTEKASRGIYHFLLLLSILYSLCLWQEPQLDWLLIPLYLDKNLSSNFVFLCSWEIHALLM